MKDPVIVLFQYFRGSDVIVVSKAHISMTQIKTLMAVLRSNPGMK
jgi:excinuclease UvrABC helicase subunit UvrB